MTCTYFCFVGVVYCFDSVVLEYLVSSFLVRMVINVILSSVFTIRECDSIVAPMPEKESCISALQQQSIDQR